VRVHAPLRADPGAERVVERRLGGLRVLRRDPSGDIAGEGPRLDRLEQDREGLGHELRVVLGDLVRGGQPGLDGPEAEEAVGERVDRAHVGGVERAERVGEPSPAQAPEVRARELAEQRLAEPAAFRVKVIAATRASEEAGPSSSGATSWTRRATSSVVLPVPAPASATTFTPRARTAASRSAWSGGTLAPFIPRPPRPA
jgi:hypothetical protein